MTKKEQAIEALRPCGLDVAFVEATQSVRIARESLASLQGEELQAVKEAYAELMMPSCRTLMAELERFNDAVGSGDGHAT